MNRRDKLYHLIVKINPLNLNIRDRHRELCKNLSKQIRQARNAYNRDKLRIAGNDMGKMWKAVSEMTTLGTKQQGIHKLTKGDIEITNGTEIANEFNEYFANIEATLAAQIVVPDTKISSVPIVQNSMFLYEVDHNEIMKIIKNLKSNKAPGIDNISARIIKLCAGHVVVPLVHIINLAFSTGKCPKHFKTAVVVPIFKAGNNTLASNYRPISLLPIISKIFERCLGRRIESFLQRTGVLNQNQFDFRKNISTASAIGE